MAFVSAGLLVYRRKPRLEVFLGHPGGPYWHNKDEGVWSIPKGNVEEGEDRLEAARREFLEETGFAPQGPFAHLGSIVMKSGKTVYAWTTEDDFDPTHAKSNTMEMEWPPHSRKFVTVPELDQFGWFDLETACFKLLIAQRAFVARLAASLAGK